MADDEFDDSELEDLYTWIDCVPLTRPKKNITRDFADGILVAEVVRHFFPHAVELHNYSARNSEKGKMENWYFLNRHVFPKLNFKLSEEVIRDAVMGKDKVIEKILLTLRSKIDRANWELKKQPESSMAASLSGRRAVSDRPEADQHMMSPGRQGKKSPGRGPRGRSEKPSTSMTSVSHNNRRTYTDALEPEVDREETFYRKIYKDSKKSTAGMDVSIPKQKGVRSLAESDMVPRAVYEEREQECLAKEETIKILLAKVHRFEHLVKLKDVRIDDLTNRLEQMRPTGSNNFKR